MSGSDFAPFQRSPDQGETGHHEQLNCRNRSVDLRLIESVENRPREDDEKSDNQIPDPLTEHQHVVIQRTLRAATATTGTATVTTAVTITATVAIATTVAVATTIAPELGSGAPLYSFFMSYEIKG